MQRIILNEKLSFFFEPSDKKIRLVVTTADEELVCRKETLKKLHYFLAEEHAHLFKGRLQLFKSGDEIAIQVKNEIIVKIPVEKFRQALN